MFGFCRSVTRRFRKSEDGAFTIEAVLWMPIFIAVLCLVADASMIFGRRAEVLRIVQDANRAMAVGKIRDLPTAETYIMTRIGNFAPNAAIATTVTEGVIRTVVTIPASDLTAAIPFGLPDSLTVSVAAEHLLEA